MQARHLGHLRGGLERELLLDLHVCHQHGLGPLALVHHGAAPRRHLHLELLAHVRLAVPVLLGRERVVVAEAGVGVLRLLGRERADVLRQNLVLEPLRTLARDSNELGIAYEQRGEQLATAGIRKP